MFGRFGNFEIHWSEDLKLWRSKSKYRKTPKIRKFKDKKIQRSKIPENFGLSSLRLAGLVLIILWSSSWSPLIIFRSSWSVEGRLLVINWWSSSRLLVIFWPCPSCSDCLLAVFFVAVFWPFSDHLMIVSPSVCLVIIIWLTFSRLLVIFKWSFGFLAIFWSTSGCLLIAFGSLCGSIFWTSFGHLLMFFWSSSDDFLIVLWSSSDCFLVVFWRFCDHSLIVFWPFLIIFC